MVGRDCARVDRSTSVKDAAGAGRISAASRADLAVSVTGVAGPGGGGEKPVGLVHFASTRKGGATHAEHHAFAGDRAAVRAQSAALALRLILRQAESA